jgi:gliding motility-associated-like protein
MGQAIELVNNSLYGNSYLWSINNIPVSKEFAPVVALSEVGEYDVNLSVKDQYGCEKIITKLDFIKVTKPNTDFDAFQTSGECPPLITSFVDKSTGNVKAWSWDFGDGQKSTLKNPTNTYTTPGTFDVTLIATDENGCKGELKQNSIVSVGGPYGTYTILNPELCLGDTLRAEVQSTNTSIHHWDFGDGTVVDDGNTSISHIYNFSSNFILNLVFIDDNGCMVIADHAYTIKVSPIPEAEFTYLPKYPFEGDEISFKGIQDSFTHQWKIGDNVFSNEKDASAQLPPGKHDVTLIVTTDMGCAKDTTQQISVQGDLTFIPNVFTPNSDEFNQTFDMPGVENGTWTLRIFNRWGRMVFETNNYQGDWKAEGESAGVYYFDVRNAVRPEKYYKGWVHVVK